MNMPSADRKDVDDTIAVDHVGNDEGKSRSLCMQNMDRLWIVLEDNYDLCLGDKARRAALAIPGFDPVLRRSIVRYHHLSHAR